MPRAILSDLGSDSEFEKKLSYDVPEKSQIAGKQVPLHPRSQHPGTHHQLHLPGSGD